MGLFSYDCLRCGHPMLAPFNVNEINSWMNDMVVLYENGSRMIGSYDGSGRVNNQDIGYPMEASCYHFLCWKSMEEPGFTKPSPSSEDQGHFFDDPAHDLEAPDPKVQKEGRASHLWTGERGPKPG